MTVFSFITTEEEFDTEKLCPKSPTKLRKNKSVTMGGRNNKNLELLFRKKKTRTTVTRYTAPEIRGGPSIGHGCTHVHPIMFANEIEVSSSR